MKNNAALKLNTLLVVFFFAAALTLFSIGAYAASVPSASGQINSSDGAILRESSSTSSSVVKELPDNTKVRIHKEVFKSKTSLAKKNRWYYVTALGTKGYVRADLVDNIKHGSVQGKTTEEVIFRRGPGTEMKQEGTLFKGVTIPVALKANPVASTKGSSGTWYKIKISGKYYYVCSSSIKLAASTTKTDTQSTTKMTDSEFKKYLKKQGFPASYQKKLIKLHKAHPNWRFVAYKTSISWKTALKKQTKGGTSLVASKYSAKYRDGTKQYEKGWYKANGKVVAYYMDPRNFLNAKSIYMFENLTYKPKYQKQSAVSSILAPTKLPKYGFTPKMFMNAGKASNVNPIFLASRARQETGSGGAAINGSKILGTKVYNPFNIGAFGGANPLHNGLIYAYGKGWTTQGKALKGGARELARNYINKGQYTIYYQRFNVRNGVSKAGTHQYMTNIMAPYTEASTTKESYKKYGILNKPLVFEIPVYEGMPASTKLP